MIEESGFPRQLLDSSQEDKYQYFKQKTIKHTKLTHIDKQVQKAVKYAPQGSLIFVLGTTGIGKTTLQHGLMRAITEKMQLLLEQDKGRIPVAAIEADAPTHGGYNYKTHFRETLKALNEPLIDYKIDIPPREGTSIINGRLINNERTSIDILREASVEAFKQRMVTAFFVDEAQHIGKTSSGVTLKDNLDVLKTIANKSKTTHVLLGTYELLILQKLSAQLTRRSKVFHFGRYKPNEVEDMKSFRDVIGNFQIHLPFPQPVLLTPHLNFLMQYSLGCVGVLKEWLLRELQTAVEESAKSLTIEHLEATRLSDREWISLASEIKEAENSMIISQDEIVGLQEGLGFNGSPAKKELPNLGASDAVTPTQKKKGNRYPGRRKPKRDPVGR